MHLCITNTRSWHRHPSDTYSWLQSVVPKFSAIEAPDPRNLSPCPTPSPRPVTSLARAGVRGGLSACITDSRPSPAVSRSSCMVPMSLCTPGLPLLFIPMLEAHRAGPHPLTRTVSLTFTTELSALLHLDGGEWMDGEWRNQLPESSLTSSRETLSQRECYQNGKDSGSQTGSRRTTGAPGALSQGLDQPKL